VATIRDTGCGISPQYLDVIFEPFRQADSSMTRPHQGAGLGLSIVKHLVQRMGGSIEVDSRVAVEGQNGGSVFTVKIPVVVPQRDQERGETENDENQRRGKHRRRRVNILCRHPRTAALFEEIWNEHGFDSTLLSTTSSPSQIVSHADIVWTDVATMCSEVILRQLLVSVPETPKSQLLATQASPTSLHGALICIMHTSADELAVLEPELSKAKNVMLVKRPVLISRVLELVHRVNVAQSGDAISDWSNLKYALADPPRLRFATANIDVIAGERIPVAAADIRRHSPSMSLAHTSVQVGSTAESPIPEVAKRRVLLVEDNLVNYDLQWLRTIVLLRTF
jgi:hypothetical protein